LRNIFKASSGNYLLYGQATTEIVSYESSLNYLGSAYTNTDNGAGNYYGMLELSDESFLLFGDFFNMGIVTKINSQYMIVWQKYYYDTSFTPSTGKFSSAHRTNNNKVVLLAQGESSGNKPCILSIDTLGNVLECKLIVSTGINVCVKYGMIPGTL